MRVRLKGVHSATATLADGRRVAYFYAWKGGPRLNAEPGTPEFIAAFNAAHAERKKPSTDTLDALISEYRASGEYRTKAPRTRTDYARYLDLIGAKFGTLPIEALADPRVRGDFKEWRDGFADKPRKADLAWSVLARVLSVAKDRGRITVNPCERGGRLYASERSQVMWTDDMVQRALAAFPAHLRWVLLLALWTGQRQGDLIAMPWSAISDGAIHLRQSKTGRRVVVPVKKTLKAILAEIPKRSTIILTTTDGTPWTGDGLRASWRKACAKAGIEGVTFHDIRGTTVTNLYEEGAPEGEIAAITGHSLKEVGAILDTYLTRTRRLAENAIDRLERKEARTKSAKRLQNGSKRSTNEPGDRR